MQVNELREKFLSYFAKHSHTVVQSSSLVPYNDPTLLFTNAGMNQFKDVFLGVETRDYTRATSAQKCVRAGGKHNDLENVGYTARHHTFFEMLGNFSFGDYFKTEALTFAWEFLTKILALPADKLYVTVYHTDDEAFNIWHRQIGLDTDRIIRINDKADGSSDNFWQMGDTGPCGPCSEIFYDHGESIPGGLPGSPNEDGDRYVEIWNCVFMQFNRDNKGVLHKLPKPAVDTGMGLERIAAVMQQVHSNYAINLFVDLISYATQITCCTDLNHASLKILADHIRASAFLLADGVTPDNEGRGYVLRRIMRRAIRHGYKLGMREPFFHQLVLPLVNEMGNAYPELIKHQSSIITAITQEEEKFLQTINNGMELLTSSLSVCGKKILNGDIAFKLYDTYGFPLDLTQDICREQQVTVDLTTFDTAMAKQKSMARAAGKFKSTKQLDYTATATNFLGYHETSTTAKITALYKDNQAVTELHALDSGIVILDQSVFYAESGGQVGDTGILQLDASTPSLFTINDTQKIKTDVIGHLGTLTTGNLKVGDQVTLRIDVAKRIATARNHSATHLLHQALHTVLGNHALQKGSLVNNSYTRFDFAHDKAVTDEELREIERMVNQVIMANSPVSCTIMDYEEALTSGAMALFGEKYAKRVRVIKMGDFSTELCGGTHVTRTGDIGLFVILNESGIANGVRRIEAITGDTALAYLQESMRFTKQLQNKLKAQTPDIVCDKIDALLDEKKNLLKQVSHLTTSLAISKAHEYLSSKPHLLPNGCQLLAFELPTNDAPILNELVAALSDMLNRAIIVVGCKNILKVDLVVGVTKDLTNTYQANVIINRLAALIDGKGGGKATLAKAQGKNGENLSHALSHLQDYLCHQAKST